MPIVVLWLYTLPLFTCSVAVGCVCGVGVGCRGAAVHYMVVDVEVGVGGVGGIYGDNCVVGVVTMCGICVTAIGGVCVDGAGGVSDGGVVCAYGKINDGTMNNRNYNNNYNIHVNKSKYNMNNGDGNTNDTMHNNNNSNNIKE